MSPILFPLVFRSQVSAFIPSGPQRSAENRPPVAVWHYVRILRVFPECLLPVRARLAAITVRYLAIVAGTTVRPSLLSYEKHMPAHKVGKLWKFSKAELDKWVRSGKVAEYKN